MIESSAKFVAEFTKDGIYIWEFIDDSKRLIATLQNTPHNIEEAVRLVESLNNGEEYV